MRSLRYVESEILDERKRPVSMEWCKVNEVCQTTGRFAVAKVVVFKFWRRLRSSALACMHAIVTARGR